MCYPERHQATMDEALLPSRPSELSVFVASDCCPVGCGMDVAMLRAGDGGSLFCYCIGCGCTWLDPADAQIGAAFNEAISITCRTAIAVQMASRLDLEEAGLWNAAIRESSSYDWSAELVELNRKQALPEQI